MSDKPIIAVDIDEVLGSFVKALSKWYNNKFGTNFNEKSYHSYDFHKVWNCSLEQCNKSVELFFLSNVFKNDIEPVDGALEALIDLKDNGYELHVVTARHEGVKQDTINWINKYYPNIFQEIHFGNHYSKLGKNRKKSEICRDINATVLIDDSWKYAKDLASNQQYCILFGDYAWNTNQGTFNDDELNYVRRASNWSILKYTLKALQNSGISRVAALQLCSTNDMTKNLNKILLLLKDASNQSVSMAVLPEAALYMGQGGTDTWKNAHKTKLHESYHIRVLMRKANQYDMWIILGGFACLDDKIYDHEPVLNDDDVNKFNYIINNNNGSNSDNSISNSGNKDDMISINSEIDDSHESPLSDPNFSKMLNTCVLISPKGTIVHTYSKLHLFDAPAVNLHESIYTQPGRQGEVVYDCGFAKVGLTICYDLRFPEMYINLRNQGADIIVAPSAFTERTGKWHWELLLRARAIDSQCMIIGAAQCGKHNDVRHSFGNVMCVDAHGSVTSIDDSIYTCYYSDNTFHSNSSLTFKRKCEENQGRSIGIDANDDSEISTKTNNVDDNDNSTGNTGGFESAAVARSHACTQQNRQKLSSAIFVKFQYCQQERIRNGIPLKDSREAAIQVMQS